MLYVGRIEIIPIFVSARQIFQIWGPSSSQCRFIGAVYSDRKYHPLFRDLTTEELRTQQPGHHAGVRSAQDTSWYAEWFAERSIMMNTINFAFSLTSSLSPHPLLLLSSFSSPLWNHQIETRNCDQNMRKHHPHKGAYSRRA